MSVILNIWFVFKNKLKKNKIFVAVYRKIITLVRKIVTPTSPQKKIIPFNRHSILKEISEFTFQPELSVIVPVFNPPSGVFIAMMQSVFDQMYQNWELCLADASTTVDIQKLITSIPDSRKFASKIKYKAISNQGISGNSNVALKMAGGTYIALLDHDDLLTSDALFEVVKLLNKHPKAEILYSDENKVSADGAHFFDPFYKPDWSPDLFMSLMYTCHFTVYKKTLLDTIGEFDARFDGAQDYDLMMRASEKTNEIFHIPKILYHWRAIPGSIADNIASKDYASKAVYELKLEALKRRKIPGSIQAIPEMPGQFKVKYSVQNNSLVSIIIPTRDNFLTLKACVNSILCKSTYQNIEIIILNNQSKDALTLQYFEQLKTEENKKIKVFDFDKPFNFSEINNFGTLQAQGLYYIFLNDDTEVITPTWIEEMLGYAQMPHIGAVGAYLVYPDSLTIQHCGVVNTVNGPGHALHNFSPAVYYYGRSVVDYNWIAVTGACLMIAADKFKTIKGFEERLPIAYNDIELCFKAHKAGYHNIVANEAKLYHYESKSRGSDSMSVTKMNRLQRERDLLYSLHPDLQGKDPFYNPNFRGEFCDFSFFQ